MYIRNGLVLDENFQFKPLSIGLAGDKIAEVTEGAPTEGMTFDATGLYVVPGLVDIHIHACNGFDFCDGTKEAIEGMSAYLIKQGITSFIATSMAFDEERLEQIFRIGQEMIAAGIPKGAQMRGIHMEGPFFSKAKKGAQSEKYIIDPDIMMFKRLQEVSGQTIRIVDVAPELEGAMSFIREAAQETTVSLAHTMADYDTATEAFAQGASHVTHLFNAMPAFSHRDPGVVGAAFDAKATVEMICDGIHLHPAVIRSVFSWFGQDRVVLISDAMRACGLEDGHYDLGGQEVLVNQGKATLIDGTIAGSATNLYTCMKNAVSFGISLEMAVKAATINPAKVVGIDQQVGSIAVGKQADFLLLDRDLNIAGVFIGGQPII